MIYKQPMYTLFLFLTIIIPFNGCLKHTSGFGHGVSADSPANSVYYLPNLAHPFPVKLQLPDNFEVAPFREDNSPVGGVLWSSKETLHEWTAAKKPNLNKIKDVSVIARLSLRVLQRNDQFTNEDKIEEVFTKAGVKDLKIRKIKWGNFPVLAVDGTHKNGNAMHLAWIGLNAVDGKTLYLELQVPTKFGRPNQQDLDIWNALLEKSSGIPLTEYYTEQGYEIEIGKTRVTRHKMDFSIEAEKRSGDGKVGVLVKSGNSSTVVTYTKIADFKLRNREAVLLTLRIEVGKGDKKKVFYETVPAVLLDSGEFSFPVEELKKVLETEKIVVLFPK